MPFALAWMALGAATGCGPRQTLDAYDRLCFAPVKIAPGASIPNAASVTADLDRALPYYARETGLFREVRLGCGEAGTTTAVVEPTVLCYTEDRGRCFSFLSGRAAGNAVIRYVLRDREGGEIRSFDDRSFARSGPGWFVGLPPALGGVDATAEGAGASLYLRLERNKSNPKAARRPPPDGDG